MSPRAPLPPSPQLVALWCVLAVIALLGLGAA